MSLFPEYGTHEIAHAIINKLLNGDFSKTISFEQIKNSLKNNSIVIETKRNGFGEIIGYEYTVRKYEETIHD